MRRIFFAILGLALLPLLVWAVNDVSVDNNVTLVLPSDSSEYTLHTTGIFTSLTINNDNFSFSMSGGSSARITSNDKKQLTNSLSAAIECTDTFSQVFLSLAAGASAQTVTVTPSGTCAGGGSGGGGGTGIVGGGGGGAPAPAVSAPTVAKVTQLKQQISQLQQNIAQRLKAPSGVPPAFGVFALDLEAGMRDEEVRRLQELFKQDPELYPEGLVTGFYGPLTTSAVKRFQARHNLPQVGRVGPLTRKKLGEVYGISVPAPVPVPEPAPAPVPAPVAPQATSGQLEAIREQIRSLQTRIIQEQIKLIQEKIKALQK